MQALASSFAGLRLAPTAAAPQQQPRAQRSGLVVRASALAEAATLEVKKLDGSAAGTAQLGPIRVADADTANGLVHRYLTTAMRNARQGTASTLTRGEVRGGGRKPYKQKGSGNARLGTKRTPLRPGGGISFGPKPRDWSAGMNKKEKKLALATALASAAPDMLVCDDFSVMTETKTKALVGALAAMGVASGEKVLLILGEPTQQVYFSGRNVPTLAINTASAVQVYDVLNADRIIVEKGALAYLNEWFGPAAADA